MNIFKTKKFILTTLILLLMTTLSFGMLQVFSNKNVQIYALDGVTEKSKDSGWSVSGDVYSCSITGGIFSSKSASVNLTVYDQGTLKISYTNSSGSLTITNSAAGFSHSASGNPTTAVTLEIGLAAGENTITATCKTGSGWRDSAAAQFTLISIDRTQGIAGTSIDKGYGTADSPYIIDEQADFAVMNQALSAVYELGNNITLSGNFTPIGSASAPFTGTFDGKGYTISNMTISGGTYRGMFAQTNGGTIKDLTLNNFNMTGASTYSAMLIGYAVNGTVVENVNLHGKLSAVAGNVGGLVGYANGTSAVKVKNCNIYGSVITTGAGNIGGLSGAGGTFENCVVYANVSGVQLVGGITGGYKNDMSSLEKLSGAEFGSYTNCYVAGDVAVTGVHNNNYPYWGLVNGYGAYCKYVLSNVGQRISFTYTTSVDVEEIRVFNSNVTPDGLVVNPTSTGEGYSFTQDVTLTNTYAGGSSNASSLSSETAVTGITGNYGGLTIRFKMADGTYKYISTLNKAESKFQSVFDVNLDNLTSYVDNFSSIEIDTSIGTGSYTTSDSISVWGTAKVASANDFEHLSWIINGAIPTTFANGVYYNARSVATLSISLQADIDLTTLNPTNHNFYGLGKTEMYPYRGSIYGNGHSLTVNMNFPNAYLMGIICVATDQENQIVVENLTVNGTIVGRYRVGIVGMNDNYTRTCSVAFTNVTNNANITAISQVGAFLGEAQGGGGSIGTKENAKIYLTNCVNNGNITATAGDAGGLVGNLNHIHNAETYAVVTLNNCANNGKVSATGYAGGFVAGISNTVTVEGINTNSGIVTSSSGNANFYVGNIGSGSFSTTDGLQTIYRINLGVTGESWTISSTGANIYNASNESVTQATYTADNFGVISVKFANVQKFNGISLSLSVPLLKNAVTITPSASNNDSYYSDEASLTQYKKTMATFVKVPTSIVLSDNNVYDISSSKDSWKVEAIVTNNDGSSETITLTILIDSEKLNTNQLVFANVSVDHSIYVVDSFVKNFYRITSDVEDYVTKSTELTNKTSGTNEEFTTLGLSVQTAYNELITELSQTGFEADLDRFNNYISNEITNIKNKDTSFELLTPYFKNIVSTNGINVSELQNVAVDYGTYSFTKTITFTMLSGDIVSKDITYSFAKNYITNELNATAKTSGVSFKVGEITTCSYNENVDISINKINILQVEIENAEFVFDNTEKTTTASLSLLDGDSVDYTLAYNGETSAINVGEYEVTLALISGADAMFYNIPESYEKAKLIIKAINFVVNAAIDQKFTYNQSLQATDFTLTQNTSGYELSESDYKVEYSGVTASGEAYVSDQMPAMAGSYTATVSFVNENLAFAGANTFAFEIQPQKLSEVYFDPSLNYNATVPTFEFTFPELLEGDEVTVSYVIFDKKSGVESDAKNAGEYTLQITDVGNKNYYVEDLIRDVVVKQAEISIEIFNQSSTYGEEVTLDQSAFELSGTIFGEDELGLVLSTQATSSSNADDYKISGSINNDNYNVTYTTGIYTIDKKEMSIDYGTTVYDYQSQDFYGEIKPELLGVLEKDIESFVFELYLNSNVVTEFKNAGTYHLRLVDNEVVCNYSIEQPEQIYQINPKYITLKAKDIEKNYNQAITIDDFALETVELVSPDTIEQVVGITFEVLKDTSPIDYTQKLDVGKYDIYLDLAEGSLYNNYVVTCELGTLKISERATYIEAKNIEKFYDEKPVEFVAEFYSVDNEKITDAEITYTFTLNGNIVTEMKDVGTYEVSVSASAGENNKTATAKYSVVIKTNVITIALNNADHVYDGKEYVPDYSYVMNCETDISSILRYDVLDAEKVETSATNVGKYYVQFNVENKNYALQKTLFDVTIKPIDITIEIEDDEIVYGEEIDIQAFNYSLTGSILSGDKFNIKFIAWHYDGTVGEYEITAIDDNTNYNLIVGRSGTLYVKQRELSVQYVGESVLNYNELGHDNLLNAQVSNALSDDVWSVYYLNSNNQQIQSVVDAGTYTLVVKLNDTHNYKFVSTEEDIITTSINIGKKIMDLSIAILDKTYDGSLVEFNGVYSDNTLVETRLYAVEYYKNETIVSHPKDVGEYTIKIVETDSKNYEFINNLTTFKISSRELTINEIEKEYDYSRTTIKPILSLNNVVEGEEVVLNVEYVETPGKFKEIGEYTIKINGIEGLNATNYHLNASETITYKIVPIQVQVTIENSEFVFTNKQITKQQLGVGFISDLAILESDYSISALPTTVGTYSIDFISLNTGLEFNISKFDVKVQEAEITEIKFEDKVVNYNNKTHRILVDKTTLSNGIEINVKYSSDGFVNAGTYTIVATLSNENYITKQMTATLTINQITLQVETSKTTSFTYNANEQGLEILGLEDLWYQHLISYEYVGENYSSTQKPTNVGEYSLQINANNENNIIISNVDNLFEIKTKAVTIQSLQTQTATYSAQPITYKVDFVGVIGNEEVVVEVLYNNEKSAPINAGTYKISFVSLSGAGSSNYHIENSTATSLLTINPYQISIRAENKSKIYGDEDLSLTYVSDALLGSDKFTGALEREPGQNVNSYVISQGTLTAGYNYTINYTKAIYNITRRQLGYNEFEKEFTYNGTSQIPDVTFTNVVAGDKNVAKVNTVGDSTNAGSYTLQLAIINPNYLLPEDSSFEIVINKLEANEKIIALITIEKDYNGEGYEPMVMIDGDYDYCLSYKFNDEPIAEMINAGTYEVIVELNTRNFTGTKSFEFTINKIEYDRSVLDSINVDISSKSLTFSGLENISLSIDNVNFVENKIENLESKTSYNVFVKVHESENYKTTTFLLGEFTTCPSAKVINEQINEIINKDIASDDINDIKEILKECEELTESEQAILNNEDFLNLKNQYEEYFNEIKQEIEVVKIASDIVDFGSGVEIVRISSVLPIVGLGMVCFKKGKKKDEFEN